MKLMSKRGDGTTRDSGFGMGMRNEESRTVRRSGTGQDREDG